MADRAPAPPELAACELCGRRGVALTRHHLIPRTRLKGKRNPGRQARQQALERIALLCPPCHQYAHEVIPEREMAERYSTVQALREHPLIGRFARWIASRPPGFEPKSRGPRSRRS
jgi:hypothetical protein